MYVATCSIIASCVVRSKNNPSSAAPPLNLRTPHGEWWIRISTVINKYESSARRGHLKLPESVGLKAFALPPLIVPFFGARSMSFSTVSSAAIPPPPPPLLLLLTGMPLKDLATPWIPFSLALKLPLSSSLVSRFEEATAGCSNSFPREVAFFNGKKLFALSFAAWCGYRARSIASCRKGTLNTY